MASTPGHMIISRSLNMKESKCATDIPMYVRTYLSYIVMTRQVIISLIFLSLPPNDRGVWNVPFITAAVLISGKLLSQLKDDLPSYQGDEFSPDMTFAAWMRERVYYV